MMLGTTTRPASLSLGSRIGTLLARKPKPEEMRFDDFKATLPGSSLGELQRLLDRFIAMGRERDAGAQACLAEQDPDARASAFERHNEKWLPTSQRFDGGSLQAAIGRRIAACRDAIADYYRTHGEPVEVVDARKRLRSAAETLADNVEALVTLRRRLAVLETARVLNLADHKALAAAQTRVTDAQRAVEDAKASIRELAGGDAA